MADTSEPPSAPVPEPTSALPVPATADIAAFHAQFLPLAQAIDPRDVSEFVGDASLVYHNAERGTTNVMAHATRIPTELPTVAVAELSEIPNLAQAFMFTARRVQRNLKSPGTTAELLQRAYTVRETLLEAARPLVRNALLPKGEIDRIITGRGRLDAANDCVDLAAVFRANWGTVRGKTLVTEAHLQEAAEVGATLQTVLHPERTRRRPELTAEMQETIDQRNRFWALLRTRHRLLWRVGAWLFGPDVDELVPSLLSFRVLNNRKEDTADVPSAKPTDTKSNG